MDQRASAVDQDLKDILHTRMAIAHKLNELEQRVRHHAEETTMQLTQIVNRTTSRVNTFIEHATNTIDPARRIQEHPWLIVGGALCAGYALGVLEHVDAPAREVRERDPLAGVGLDRVVDEADRRARRVRLPVAVDLPLAARDQLRAPGRARAGGRDMPRTHPRSTRSSPASSRRAAGPSRPLPATLRCGHAAPRSTLVLQARPRPGRGGARPCSPWGRASVPSSRA